MQTKTIWKITLCIKRITFVICSTHWQTNRRSLFLPLLWCWQTILKISDDEFEEPTLKSLLDSWDLSELYQKLKGVFQLKYFYIYYLLMMKAKTLLFLQETDILIELLRTLVMITIYNELLAMIFILMDRWRFFVHFLRNGKLIRWISSYIIYFIIDSLTDFPQRTSSHSYLKYGNPLLMIPKSKNSDCSLLELLL